MRKRKTPTPPPPKVPGVRFVKQTVYDVEARTMDGETNYRQVPRTVWVPAPPRDWDGMVARALVCAAVLGTVLSVGWTTDSIGSLLDRTNSTVTAYAVPILFDTVWLGAQAREWLERDNPERAKTARNAGYWFLIGAMAAIFAEGYQANEPLAGAVGAGVAGLAKFLWVLALGYYAVELDEGTAWDLQTRRQNIAVRLSLRAWNRRLEYAEGYERHVYGDQGSGTGGVQVTRYAAEDLAGTAPAPMSPAVPPVSPPPVPDRAPMPAPPTASPVSPQFTHASTTPVPPSPTHTWTASPPPMPPAMPPAESGTTAPAPHLQVVGGKTDFIRAAIAADPAITLDELTAQVRDAFGDKKDLRKDVRRLRSRIEGKAS
ncbi:hypothetical protein [Streptomyces alfalfae]